MGGAVDVDVVGHVTLVVRLKEKIVELYLPLTDFIIFMLRQISHRSFRPHVILAVLTVRYCPTVCHHLLANIERPNGADGYQAFISVALPRILHKRKGAKPEMA